MRSLLGPLVAISLMACGPDARPAVKDLPPSTPDRIVRTAYAIERAHLRDPGHAAAPWARPHRGRLFTNRFAALWERDELAAQGEIGKIDFDPFLDAQDYDDAVFAKLAIDVPSHADDRAEVRARFTNSGVATEVRFDVVLAADGWRIDDIRVDGRSVAALLE